MSIIIRLWEDGTFVRSRMIIITPPLPFMKKSDNFGFLKHIGAVL